MSISYEDALQRMQVLNQFMNQVTPQLQQLGVDRSGYRGYAQAYQSAVNNNLAVPQDFADIMYEYGGFGNTGKQLFEPSKDGNPSLTQEGIAYASQNLPEGVALHQGFFDFGKQVSDLAKSKGDNTNYKTLQQQINAAAGYGMEIPQHIQDLSYAAGLGGTPDAQALYNMGFSGGQKLFNPREGKGGALTNAGRAYASQNLPEGMSLSDAFFNYDHGSYDFLKQQGVTDIPRSIIERSKIAEAAGYQTPQYIKDMMYASGIDTAQTSNNAAPTPAASTPTTTPAAPTSTPTPTPAPAKFAANEGTGSNAPEFLAQFKKQLEDKAASERPSGTYGEVTGDTSTKGAGPKTRANRPYSSGVFDRLVNNLEESRNNRGSSSLRQTIENVTERPVSREELQEARSRYARDSRRPSGRRSSSSGRARSNSDSTGTEFGPGRARRDSSSSSYSESRRDRSFGRPGRSSRNRSTRLFGR